MIECSASQTNRNLVEGWRTVSAGGESFANAACADDILGAFFGQMPRADLEQTRGAQSCAQLESHVRRWATAAKAMEVPASAPNPKRVGRWLETSTPHISPVFSSLRERGPPGP